MLRLSLKCLKTRTIFKVSQINNPQNTFGGLLLGYIVHIALRLRNIPFNLLVVSIVNYLLSEGL